MRFQGFIGPAYTAESVNIDAQRCVNLYLETNQSGVAKEGEPSWLRSTPGLEKLIEIGDGPIRLVHTDPTGRIFIASGNEMYKLELISGVWTETLLGTLVTSSGVVRAASSDLHTVFVDGDTCYAFYTSTGPYVEWFGTFGSFGYSAVDNATHVVFIDGYYVFCDGTSNKFYCSDLNSLVVTPLDFASTEGDPDNISGLIANNRDLWIFNERSTEVFTNTGNADFPFERISGGFIENGCIAPGSIAKISGSVFWLSADAFGSGMIFGSSGLSPLKISTHAIETAISKYSNIKDAVAFTYQSGGHEFYVINFAEATWVFDLSTKTWHERTYNNSGNIERHRANFHSYNKILNYHLIGDYANNKVYRFNDQKYSDDGAPIVRIRAAPHISASGNYLFCSQFNLDMETGVGLDGIGDGTDPVAVLDFSDDGGHTWSNELEAKIGKIGEYKTRVIWNRLGKFRDRVFRIKISEKVKVAISGANLELGGQ